MKTVCSLDKCTGCMACIDICNKQAIEIKDSLFAYNAYIQEDRCINCNACHQVCQINNPIEQFPPIEWYQGWAKEEEIRGNSSSGGFATAIEKHFMESGGIVVSCVFKNGKFTFEEAYSMGEIDKFSGSKYVKSNPIGIHKKVKTALQKGEKVLFVGLPCQVAGLKNYVGNKLYKNLYTIDLICHGTPSPKILECFLAQYGYKPNDLRKIRFRNKTRFQVLDEYRPFSVSGTCDCYSTAFLNSVCYTENCYECSYAKKERVSDITLGDSWGSEIQDEEIKKGISLALCQTEKGMALLKNANIHLMDVDIEKSIKVNHQLQYPSDKPSFRKQFVNGLMEKKKFNVLIWRYYPWICFKQTVKALFIKLKIIGRGYSKALYEVGICTDKVL